MPTDHGGTIARQRGNVLASVLVAAMLACAAGGLPAVGAEPELYRVFVRPDGAYRVVVLRRPQAFAMPGQAGDAPGIVQLFDRDGHLLNQADINMVQMVEAVDWSDHRARIKRLVDWPLTKLHPSGR